MKKILFKNEILNTVIGVLLIAFAIVAYFMDWMDDFFGVIIGIAIILISAKRFIETFRKIKKKETTAILVIEVVADLVCGFVLITTKSDPTRIGLFVGIVFYIRGLAYLLINYFATRRSNLLHYFLNIGFITLGSYLIFGGNTYLDVIGVIILVVIGLVGLLYAVFGIRDIVEKAKKKPKKPKKVEAKKVEVKKAAITKETTAPKEAVKQEKMSMTDSVKKTLPQTTPAKVEIKVEPTKVVVAPVKPSIDYEQLTVTELKSLCKRRGLSNYATLRKNELIDLLK